MTFTLGLVCTASVADASLHRNNGITLVVYKVMQDVFMCPVRSMGHCNTGLRLSVCVSIRAHSHGRIS